jgi:hypothetical protein
LAADLLETYEAFYTIAEKTLNIRTEKSGIPYLNNNDEMKLSFKIEQHFEYSEIDTSKFKP